MYQETVQDQMPDKIRLADEDVRAIIELWAEQQGFSGQASLADVAGALDTTTADVQALLDEVHARRDEAQLGTELDMQQRLLPDIYGRPSLRATSLLCRMAKKPKRRVLPSLKSLKPWDVTIYLSYGSRPLLVIGMVMTTLVALTIITGLAFHWM